MERHPRGPGRGGAVSRFSVGSAWEDAGAGLRWGAGAALLGGFLAAIGGLALLDVRTSFEAPRLLAALNTALLFVVPGLVAWLSAKAYRSEGELALLLLGCGNLAFGASSLVAGWLMGAPGSPNPTVTLHNAGALGSGLFHVAAALATAAERVAPGEGRRRVGTVAAAYAAILVALGLLTAATLSGATPAFFLAGQGPTVLRQLVLGSAVCLFAGASVAVLLSTNRSGAQLMYGYGLGLALIAVGLLAVLLQPSVASPLGWVGRGAQYLAGLLFLRALSAFFRRAHASDVPPAQVLRLLVRESEANYRALVESLRDAVVSLDDRGCVLLWNPGAERLFGHPRAGVVAKPLLDVPELAGLEPLFLGAGAGSPASAAGGRTPGVLELRDAAGRAFPAEVTVATGRGRRGPITTLILRDISERRSAEEAIRALNRELEARVAARTAELEQALRERQTILDAAPVGISMTVERRQVWLNRKTEELFQYPREELENQSTRKLYASEEAYERHGAEACPRLAEGLTHETVQRLVRPDGSSIVVRYIGKAVDPPDLSKGTIWILEDVTDRHKAACALQESEARLRLAAEATGFGVYAYDFASGRAYYSPEFLALYGLPPDADLELDEDGVARALFQEDREGFLAAMRAANAPRGSGILEAEYRVARTDGELRWLRVRGQTFFSLAGEPLRAHGIIQDITDRKEAERAVQESEARFRALFEQAGDYAFVLEPRADGLIIADANEASCRTHGFSREELIGRSVLSLDTEVDEARAQKLVRRALGGETLRFETTHRRRDGSTLAVEVTAKAIQHPGRPPIILATERDVTQRKRLEAQLRHAQKMEAIGTLAGGIAHDFNNILTPVVAHAELALLQLGAEDPVRDELTGLLAGTERAAALVRQILTISRKEEGGPSTPVALAPLVQETAKFLRASMPTSIEIRTEVDPACGEVLGDLSQVHQVLLNLCTNAGYAMKDRGGVLTVSLQRERGARVRLSVRDTGAGIPKEVLGRIFEPYFTTKPQGEGSGLGLAVVHGIVTKLGGELRVETAPGEGTSFAVLFPEVKEIASTEDRGGSETREGEGRKVLVVDDEPAVRRVLVRMLEALGYRVTAASAGPEALDLFCTAPLEFDAVLTDYTMPGMNGLELARELLRARPELPVLLGTGYAEGVNEDFVEGQGVRALVAKPYTIQKLARTLGASVHPPASGAGEPRSAG